MYALTVEDCHEFFANGVLVSNCDAGLYSYRAAYHYVPREEKPRKLTREDGDEYEEMLVRKHLAEKQSNWYDEAPDDGGW